ncbi:MAG: hypothetical protein ACT4NT_07535 [Nitrososphaerota archaeon]
MHTAAHYTVYASLSFGVYFVSSLVVDVLAHNRCTTTLCLPS